MPKKKKIDLNNIMGIDPITFEPDPRLFDSTCWDWVKQKKQSHMKRKQKPNR